jgi:hypothetical protein
MRKKGADPIPPFPKGAAPDPFEEFYLFGAGIPLNGRYAHCPVLYGNRHAAEPDEEIARHCGFLND